MGMFGAINSEATANQIREAVNKLLDERVAENQDHKWVIAEIALLRPRINEICDWASAE